MAASGGMAMNQLVRGPGMLFVMLILAGCAGAGSNPSQTVAPAVLGPGDAPGPAQTAQAPVTGPLLTVPVSGTFTSDGFMPPDQVICFDPSNPIAPRPGACEAYFTMFLNMSGTLTGRITDIFHFHALENGSIDAEGTRVFTGAVDRCGSGTMSLRLDGIAPADPNPEMPGYTHIKEPMQTLLQGSTTTGLAGVIDARIRFEFNTTNGPGGVSSIPDGTVTGWIQCRSAGDAQTLSSHDKTTAIAIAGHFTMDGAQTESQAACDVETRRCELYPDLFLDLTGPIEGRMVDHGHFHYHDGSTDGSVDGYGERIFTGTIAGCGSGTLTLLVDGAAPPQPNPPNAFRYHEPSMKLVPGSTTTGLSGVMDADLVLEWNITVQGTIRDGTVTGTVWCKESHGKGTIDRDEGARAQSVTMRTITPGILLPKEGNCAVDPAKPDECDVYASQFLFADAPWDALIIDNAHLHTHRNGSVWATAERPFFGEVPGCGSGMMTFRLGGWLGSVDPVLDQPGYFHLREPAMRLVPGSTSTGLAGLVDAELTGDFVFTGPGAGTDTFTGTVWCR